jgi:hypothetical protein
LLIINSQVKLIKFDRYRCPKCFLNRKDGSDQEKEEFRKHSERVQEASKLYRSQLMHLEEDQCLIVFDYSTIHDVTKFKIKCLNYTVYRKVNGKLVYNYHDFWGYTKKDFHFTIHSFNCLFESESLKNINRFIFWADNGLKVKEIIHHFSKLIVGQKKSCHFHYFAPYHGHSVCDGHFGKGKRALRATAADGLIVKEEEVLNSFNKLKHTFPGVVLHEPDRATPCKEFTEGIRRFYHFYVNTVGKINCREKREEAWIEQRSTEIKSKNIDERTQHNYDESSDLYDSNETTETFSCSSDEDYSSSDESYDESVEIDDDLDYDSHTGFAKKAFVKY